MERAISPISIPHPMGKELLLIDAIALNDYNN